jgi:hypothetical protein
MEISSAPDRFEKLKTQPIRNDYIKLEDLDKNTIDTHVNLLFGIKEVYYF